MLNKEEQRNQKMNHYIDILEINGIDEVSTLLDDGTFECFYDDENQKIGHVASDGVIYYEIIRAMMENPELQVVGKNIAGCDFVIKYGSDKLLESRSEYHKQLVYEYQAMSTMLYSGVSFDETKRIMEAEELSIFKRDNQKVK